MHTLVAYVPVLHEGYRRFFEKYEGPKELFLYGPEISARFKPLTKEIRELDPVLMKSAIEALKIFDRVGILTEEEARALDVRGKEIICPDEDVSRQLAQDFFPNANVTLDSIFLRWDKHNALKERPVVPEEKITREEFHRRVMQEAEQEAGKSSDIWRHVGAAIVKDGKVVLVGHNAHLPSEHMPYVNGDPRSNFSKGEYIEMSTGFHAEASLIAEAARRGLCLEGTSMYVTVFPCPPCARIIAYSGTATLYYAGGYGVLDGEDILEGRGVKLICVE